MRGRTVCVRELNCVWPPGACVLLSGPNGCGKTTLLNAIAMLHQPEQGTIDYANSLGINYLGQASGLYLQWDVLQNLRWWLPNVSPNRLIELLAAWDLSDKHHQTVGELSTGQQRKLALIRFFEHPAKIWLMDEPEANLDNASQQRIAQHIVTHQRLGGLTVIASHQSQFIEPTHRLSWEEGGEHVLA